MISLQPLGDQAVLAAFDGEADALRFATAVRCTAPGWLLDVVQAYSTVAVFFEFPRIDYRRAAEWLSKLDQSPFALPEQSRMLRIPCCYEKQLDLQHISEHTGLSAEAVIRLHMEPVYTVHAIGFCPGFPYLGYLPEALSGVPRLTSPRLRVEAGSVGLTGRQTGIYTEVRPGGWNLVGQTPLELVNVADGYFPLRTGDLVRFVRIDETEFACLHGERL